VKRATVNADVLNVRNRPSVHFNVVGAVLENPSVFAFEEAQNWSRIGVDQQWVSNGFLNFNI
jgi:uncharacterized protein YgiM (DUF1202 family)